MNVFKRRSGGGKHVKRAEQTSNSDGQPFWRRRAFWQGRRVWLSTIATGVVIAVAAASLNGVLPRVVDAVMGRLPSSSAPGATAPAHKTHAPTPTTPESKEPERKGKHHTRAPRVEGHASCDPAKMVSENSLSRFQVSAWTFPSGFVPSPSEIAQIDNDYESPDLVNRALYDDGGYAPSTDTQLVLQDQCLNSASITDIQVAKSCQSPADGTIFAGQAQLSDSSSADSSAADESTKLSFNLDSSDPEAMTATGQGYDASGSIVTIPAKGTQVFDISASTLHLACKFSIRITIVANGAVYDRTFSDGGQPFRVSALLPGVFGLNKPGDHPYAGYSRLYVGGTASPWHDGTWVRENPKTWQRA
jgi:hypothetical protein